MEKLQGLLPKHGLKMPIGTLAKKTGIKIVTIRYYEGLGLLPDPRSKGGREASKNRKYSDAHVNRLHLIKELRSTSFTLKEIKQIIKWAEKGSGSSRAKFTKSVYKTMGRIDERLHILRALRRELYSLITKNFSRGL